MKGTLHKTESGWQVWYHAKDDLFYGNTGVRILPLHDGDYYEVNRPAQYSEGKEVEFEIVELPVPPTNGPVSNSISIYAKLVDQKHIPMKGGEGWDKMLNKAIEEKAENKQDNDWITVKGDTITVNFRRVPEFDDPVYPTRADQLKEQGWDVIWKDFRANKNASYSWALLEYLRDNYNPPTKKQD